VYGYPADGTSASSSIHRRKPVTARP
jgi:hypothetical protein